ncbi:Uncharacterized mitochondrial protein AtMg01250 [Linum perenne]
MVRFSILVNGNPFHFFSPTRGIRKGYPISPFLFILLTNCLSYLIDKGVDDGILKGLKLNPRCPTLTHVFFADNTILFGEASINKAIHIKKTMTRYGELTGQELNLQNSSIIFSKNTSDQTTWGF